MRKLISLFLILSLNAYGQSEPITRLKLEGSGTYVPGSSIQVPNNSATKINGSTSRLETGNTNLLDNASFEHSTVGNAWTKTPPPSSFTDEVTSVVDGKHSLKYTMTSAVSQMYQDSTTNAASISGLQGKVSAYVKTTVSGVQLCPRQAGALVTSLCLNIINDGTWREYNIPVILNGTSNGIALYKLGLTTGDVYIDNAFVGLSSPFQNVNGARLVGTVSYPTASSSSAVSSTTFSIPTNASQGATYTGALSALTTNINGYGFKISGSSGDYLIKFEGSRIGNSTATNGFYAYASWGSDTIATNDVCGHIMTPSSITGASNGTSSADFSCQFSSLTSVSGKEFYIKTKVSGGGSAVFDVLSGAKISVYYFPPESKIYSQASQDFALTNAGTFTIGATTTAPTKGTVVKDRIFTSRKGQRLIAEYQYEQSSAGTAGSGDYIFSLPSGYSFDTTIVTPYTGTLGPQVTGLGAALVGYGKVSGDTSTSHNATLIAYSATQFRILTTYSTTGHAAVGSPAWHLGFANTSYNLHLDAPIQGWQDYGVIVGSFAGIEKCNNTYDCLETFTAKITTGTGVVTDENVDWINGNCTAANGTVCTLNTNLKDGVSPLSNPMNCVVGQGDNWSYTFRVGSTATNFTVYSYGSSSGNLTSPAPAVIACSKIGVDLKPKSAKIADVTQLQPIVSPVANTIIDWAEIKTNTGLYTKTLSANTTFTFANLTAGQAINVRLTNTASNFTVTWPTVKWPGGTTPVMTTGAKSDIYSFFYDGTNIYGTYVQNY